MKEKIKESQFLLYESDDGNISVDVVLKDENIWITQKNMSRLFDTGVDNINVHLKNIYDTEELNKNPTIEEISIVQKEGNRNISRKILFYNLDIIIAVGYRVNSKKATQFRQWATKILNEFIVKGFSVDKERMKNGPKFGKDYFDELLEIIKEIRLSERRLYQKITDIFEATSVDYKSNSDEAYTFFQIVQNKLHYAISKKTAAELIFERVDSEKEHMGLTNWKNSPDGKIFKYDVSIAKNYLNKDEIKKLERLTILFLDYAEDMVEEQQIMTMKDWINVTDDLLKFRKKEILDNAGCISHKQALDKANNEYEKFRVKQDKNIVSSMDELYKKYLEDRIKSD